MARLRDRLPDTAETRGELVPCKLDRPAEITPARVCARRSTTRWIAVLAEDRTGPWCKACFLAMPA